MEIASNFYKIQQIALSLRINVLKMINAAGSGHTAGSLGMADVFATLFFSDLLNYDAKNPEWEQRDLVVLSNAHICPVYYASLAHAGYFPLEELYTLRKFGSRLQGHPNNHFAGMGIETSGGPLGQGISVSVGLALGQKLKEINNHIFCFLSDGELNEGQAWEAFMSSSKYKLNNLTFIIDRNNIQIDGRSDDVMPLEPLHDKLKSFGLEVLDVDGHDINRIYDSIKKSKESNSLPYALIMHTIPGKGVSFMQNDYHWHGKAPDNDQLNQALKELGV